MPQSASPGHIIYYKPGLRGCNQYEGHSLCLIDKIL